MAERWSVEKYRQYVADQAKAKKASHHRSHVQAGWRTIGGQRTYYRSKREANYARYLQWLLERGELHQWEYEPQRFWFPLKSGNNSYTPDFKVWPAPGRYEWHEVKGWLDKPSATKLKRMKKYHPQEPEVRLVMGKEVGAIGEQLGGVIPNWEF